jgi:hypothetical protein
VHHDYVRCRPYQFGRVRPHEICVVGGPAKLNAYVATLYPSDLAKSLPEGRHACVCFRVTLDHAHQCTDPPFTRLLRTRSKRPTNCTTAKQRDELAAFQQIELHFRARQRRIAR